MEHPQLQEHQPNADPTGEAHSPSHASRQESDPDHNGEHIPIPISKYTHALVNSWLESITRQPGSTNRISVSQTVSFLAFLYEKIRNAVEFREEHLIRRAAIERIIKRRMILNENGRAVAEPLIKELLWARYYENNTIEEEKVGEIQSTIDKYFYLRNEMASGRAGKEQERIANFMLEILSCEIEETLSPSAKREAFTNYVYQIVRPHLTLGDSYSQNECDMQVYIAVEKTFAHSDNPLFRYHLLRLMMPEITKITWKNSEKVLPSLYEVYTEIERQLRHPLADKTRNIIKKHIPPFLILRDVFEQNPRSLTKILTSELTLKNKVDEACRRRYEESRGRLTRTAIRSFIYILLTKVIFALLLEIPYDLYVLNHISYIPIAINVIVPPMLMALIVLTVTVPGDDNTRRIFQQIKSIIDVDPDGPGQLKSQVVIGKPKKVRGLLYSTIFGSLYFIMYFISFGSIIYLLSILDFSVVSQAIFLFFITLVLFFTYRVVQISKEYQVVDKEGLLTPLGDFFFLPFIKVGQWLSGEVLAKFNVIIILLDFIIEMPLKAIAEVFDEWIHFVKLKKEEIG